jgi:hypothetical protein
MVDRWWSVYEQPLNWMEQC